MSNALAPEIDIPHGVRIETTAHWGDRVRCFIKGRTLCFAGGMVPRGNRVMVTAAQPQLDQADEVASTLRAWGWGYAESRIDNSTEVL